MDRVYFKINGKKFSAGSEFSADTTLNEFIRRHAELRGTKYMCLEGGCGACVVTVRARHPVTGKLEIFSVNSCLVAVMSCDGWEVVTIEGIGNRRDGYNIIQSRLNHFFGSQCGYCSPGFVMSMYSLVQNSDRHLTQKEIENSFGSNLCRCTGYRPILEAFKSFAIDSDKTLLNKVKDIEDITLKVCPKYGNKCGGTCYSKEEDAENDDWCLVDIPINDLIIKPQLPKKVYLNDGRVWYAVNNVKSIFKALEENRDKEYMLLAGNTGKGVRPILFYPKVLIDISKVAELRTYFIDVNLVLGANMTLTDTMSLFDELSKTNENFWYLKIMYNHLDRVAHIPVRNIGTLAGNLLTKYKYPDFQSDIFLLFECIGATVTIVDQQEQQRQITLTEFLKSDIRGSVLTQIKLPPLSRRYELVTYKITTREQNAHAEVNAAFLFKFSHARGLIEEATIVYGGISSQFSHAYMTEKYLRGQYIFHNEVLQTVLHYLDKEINPDYNPPEPEPCVRKKIALGLFYKCIIKLCPKDILNPFYESGSTTTSQDRPPISKSYQEYDMNNKEFPITQPLLKKEGIIQCAGEALYSDDVPKIKDEVYASFVLSTIAKGTIESIDVSEAMKIDGVFAVFTSIDIPGINSFIRSDFSLYFENEELLASENIRFYNQPVAIVVAQTMVLSMQATKFVRVKYKNISQHPVVFTFDDAINAPKQENRLVPYMGITPTNRGFNIQKVIKGRFYSPRQYHCMMELHSCVAIPVDDGFEIHSASQFMDKTQAVIAQILKIPENLVIVKTRRCGGGFGCKISRNNFAACGSALVASKLNKPCRIIMPLPDIMRATGKRPNARLDYEVGVDLNGQIQYMDAVFYVNDGFSRNENQNPYSTSSLMNCYDASRWKVDNFGVLTDTPTNCFMRAPGGLEGISGIEHIMEHIAKEVNRDPVQIRLANYRSNDNELPSIVPMFLKKINYYRRIEDAHKFNCNNRWKKRALRMANMAFPTAYIGNYGALVSVYHGDGSVVINVGGIEIGQGIFTKVAQAAANEFGIPVSKVAVLPGLNFATPNNFATASSITTECCALAVIRSCDQINARLAPVRASMPNATWEEIVFQADAQGILLQANYLTSQNDPQLTNYSIFGVAVTEVEIDMLTGMKWIVRADVFEDAGRSINPALDVGQVEGAFVQALSLWGMENTVYNEHTGEIYTDRTWNYKIIGAKDIPNDFRVYLRRNAPNPVGVLGSKAVGEPPICMGHVLVDTVRVAVEASRHASGYDTSKFLDISVPVNNENIMRAADVKIEEFLLY